MSKFIPPPITTADRTGLTLDQGEIVFDTDRNTLWLGDGSTAGGIELGTGGGGGGSSWTDVNVTNANFTAADDTRYYLAAGVLSANRTVNMASITTRCMFVVEEDADVKYLSFTGATVYRRGGSESFTQIDGLWCTTIEKIGTKLIQTG